jgi:hypothetical protein
MPTVEQHKRQYEYKLGLPRLSERELVRQLFLKKPTSREGVQKDIERRAELAVMDPDVWLYTVPDREPVALQDAMKLHEENQAPITRSFFK